MDAITLLTACKEAGITFYTGVPDSQLKGLCDTLYDLYGVHGQRHVVAANEGGAVGLAAGHYLATGHPALVYLQNSGLGNIVNPVCSLLHDKVYGIPCLFVVGWRGEPGVHDEPQHVFQGEVTLEQLRLMDIEPYVLESSTTDEQFHAMFAHITARLGQGKCAALVIRKGALTTACRPQYANAYTVTREQAVGLIARMAGERDIFVSTTGKLSRELFEIRQGLGQGHARDFLTVGSMGHASMIALGIALAKPERRVWCLDGDGAALMHMGHLGVIAKKAPRNLIHVIMNNGAHETVGGMPVAEGVMRFAPLARDAGYPAVFTADTLPGLQEALAAAQTQPTLSLIEMFCALGARADLGRPTTTPQENRDAFMAFVQNTSQT